MADIQITLSADKAISDANELDANLHDLERTAKKLEKSFAAITLRLQATGVTQQLKRIRDIITGASLKDPVIIHARLHKAPPFRKDYVSIKRQIQNYSKLNPIILTTRLKSPTYGVGVKPSVPEKSIAQASQSPEDFMKNITRVDEIKGAEQMRKARILEGSADQPKRTYTRESITGDIDTGKAIADAKSRIRLDKERRKEITKEIAKNKEVITTMNEKEAAGKRLTNANKNLRKMAKNNIDSLQQERKEVYRNTAAYKKRIQTLQATPKSILPERDVRKKEIAPERREELRKRVQEGNLKETIRRANIREEHEEKMVKRSEGLEKGLANTRKKVGDAVLQESIKRNQIRESHEEATIKRTEGLEKGLASSRKKIGKAQEKLYQKKEAEPFKEAISKQRIASSKQWLNLETKGIGIKEKIRGKAKKINESIKRQVKNTQTLWNKMKGMLITEKAMSQEKQKPTAGRSIADITKDLDANSEAMRKNEIPHKKLIKLSEDEQNAYKKIMGPLRDKQQIYGDELLAAKKAAEETENVADKTTKAEKAHKGHSKTLDKYNKAIEKTGMGAKQYKEAMEMERNTLMGLQKEYSQLDKTQKGFRREKKRLNREMRYSRKRFKGLTKDMKAMRGGAGIMASAFGRITMTLTAIAATLFIFQELRQWVEAFIRIGTDYIKTLAQMEAQTMMTAEATETLAGRFRDMASDSTATIQDTSGAYKALRDLGLSHTDAMDKAGTVTKMARNENLKLADAARIAANDVNGLTQQHLLLDKAMSGTIIDAWATLKRDVREAVGAMLKAGQSDFIKVIDKLKVLAVATMPSLAKGVGLLAAAFTAALSPLIAMLAALGEIYDIIMIMPKFILKSDKEKEKEIAKIALDKKLSELSQMLYGPERTIPQAGERYMQQFPEIGRSGQDSKTVAEGTVTILTEAMSGLERKLEDIDMGQKQYINNTQMMIDLSKKIGPEWIKIAGEIHKLANIAGISFKKLDPKNFLPDEEMKKIHEGLFKQLRIMSNNYYRSEEAKINDLAKKTKIAAVETLKNQIRLNKTALADPALSAKRTKADTDRLKASIAAAKADMALLPILAEQARLSALFALKQKAVNYEMQDQKKLFDLIGVTSSKYFTTARKFHDNQITILDEELKIMFGLTAEGKKLYASIKEYENEQKKLKPLMDDYANAFKLTGIMADAYYQNRIKQIDEEIRRMKIRNAELDTEYLKRLKLQMLAREREKPTIEKHEAVLETTGRPTDYLIKKQKQYATEDYEEDTRLVQEKFRTHRMLSDDAHNYLLDRRRKFQFDMLEIDRLYFAKSIEAGETHFEATGIASLEYTNAFLADLEIRRKQALIINKGMVDEVNATFDRMERDFIFKIQAPKKEDYEAIYNETKIFHSKLKRMNRELLDAEYADKKERIGDTAELREWYLQRVIKYDIQELESSEKACDGIRAAFLRMYDDIEPLGKQISDSWIAGMHAFEQASKDVFMGFMENTWETWEDQKQALLGIMRSITRMFNEMVWDMIKSWAQAQFKNMMSESLQEKIFGKEGKDAAKKKTEESAATKSLAKSELELAAAIQVKVAALWELYAVQLALKSLQGGMGFGTWGGQNATSGGGWNLPRGGGGGGYGFQHGGKIEEEIFGVGQRTGKKYSFGERGTKEYVIPENKMAAILGGQSNTMADNAKLASLSPTINVQVPEQQGNSISINIPLSIEGNEQLGTELRNDIEELVENKLRETLR